MNSSTQANDEKPHYCDIQRKLHDEIANGNVILPIESKITLRQLIQTDNFETMASAIAVEREALTLMAVAHIYGKVSKDAIPDYMASEPGATPATELKKISVEIMQEHGRNLHVVEGQQSLRQYVAELDRTAQLLVETHYPAHAIMPKSP